MTLHWAHVSGSHAVKVAWKHIPVVKAPPWIQTMTAFLASPFWGLVQTFNVKQSSLGSVDGLDALTMAGAILERLLVSGLLPPPLGAATRQENP